MQDAIDPRRSGVVNEMSFKGWLISRERFGYKLRTKGRAADANTQQIGELVLPGGTQLTRVHLLGKYFDVLNGRQNILFEGRRRCPSGIS